MQSYSASKFLPKCAGKMNCPAIRSSTSCLDCAWARLAYRKCWPMTVAASCKSCTRKARIDCTMLVRTPRSGVSWGARSGVSEWTRNGVSGWTRSGVWGCSGVSKPLHNGMFRSLRNGVSRSLQSGVCICALLFLYQELAAIRKAAGCRLCEWVICSWGAPPGGVWSACTVAGGLLDNLAKTGVVVTGVVAGIRYPGPAAATDDAPGSPVTQSWCSDGVFTVVAPLVGGQQPLAIAKDRPVLGMRERPSRANLRISLAPLGRQLGPCDGPGAPVGGRGLAGLHRRHRQHEQQNTRNTPKTPAHPGGYSLEHQHTFQKPRVNPRFQAAV